MKVGSVTRQLKNLKKLFSRFGTTSELKKFRNLFYHSQSALLKLLPHKELLWHRIRLAIWWISFFDGKYCKFEIFSIFFHIQDCQCFFSDRKFEGVNLDGRWYLKYDLMRNYSWWSVLYFIPLTFFFKMRIWQENTREIVFHIRDCRSLVNATNANIQMQTNATFINATN